MWTSLSECTAPIMVGENKVAREKKNECVIFREADLEKGNSVADKCDYDLIRLQRMSL